MCMLYIYMKLSPFLCVKCLVVDNISLSCSCFASWFSAVLGVR